MEPDERPGFLHNVVGHTLLWAWPYRPRWWPAGWRWPDIAQAVHDATPETVPRNRLRRYLRRERT